MKILPAGKFGLIWLLIATVLLLVACTGGGADTTTDEATEGTTGGTTGSSPNNGTVRVNNNSSIEICYLYIYPVESGDPGADQLGELDTIEPGVTYDFTDVPPGTYDLKADDCDLNEIGLANGVEVRARETVTWELTD